MNNKERKIIMNYKHALSYSYDRRSQSGDRIINALKLNYKIENYKLIIQYTKTEFEKIIHKIDARKEIEIRRNEKREIANLLFQVLCLQLGLADEDVPKLCLEEVESNEYSQHKHKRYALPLKKLHRLYENLKLGIEELDYTIFPQREEEKENVLNIKDKIEVSKKLYIKDNHMDKLIYDGRLETKPDHLRAHISKKFNSAFNNLLHYEDSESLQEDIKIILKDLSQGELSKDYSALVNDLSNKKGLLKNTYNSYLDYINSKESHI